VTLNGKATLSRARRCRRRQGGHPMADNTTDDWFGPVSSSKEPHEIVQKVAPDRVVCIDDPIVLPPARPPVRCSRAPQRVRPIDADLRESSTILPGPEEADADYEVSGWVGVGRGPRIVPPGRPVDLWRREGAAHDPRTNAGSWTAQSSSPIAPLSAPAEQAGPCRPPSGSPPASTKIHGTTP
jgi:S-adenosyl methyltransferase